MITKLTVRNFKCLNHHDVSFSGITVLAGANGVGKSSVVQSLLLARHAKEVQDAGHTTDVDINGPYRLNLGDGVGALASEAESDEWVQSDQIRFDMENSSAQRSRVLLNVDLSRSTPFLQLEPSDGDRDFLSGRLRYLNAERIGPRRVVEMVSSPNLDLGYQGENALFVFHEADRRGVQIPDTLVHSGHSSFRRQVEAWLGTIVPNTQLRVEPFDQIGMIAAHFRTQEGTTFYIPTATGFGITYALPIIIAGLLAATESNSLFIVENPEAHLHPLGQSRMGAFLAKVAESGVQVVIETHSEHIINGSRLQLAKDQTPELMLINFLHVEDRSIVVNPIRMNQGAELTDWPPGFFDQERKDLGELMKLRRNR